MKKCLSVVFILIAVAFLGCKVNAPVQDNSTGPEVKKIEEKKAVVKEAVKGKKVKK